MRRAAAIAPLLLCACSSEYVTVSVHALPALVTNLNVRSALDQQPARMIEQFGVPSSGSFGSDTSFALNLGGARGRLSVSVEAWVGNCAAASQSGELNLTGGQLAIDLTLDKIDPQDCTGNYQHPPDMVRVPGTTFTMGCNAAVDANCETDESPAHAVTLLPYFIDRTEVSRAAYRSCIAHAGCSRAILDLAASVEAEAYITWFAAQSYCAARGKRLPTEAEWELAARGTDGRVFPWGNNAPSCDKANYSPSSGTNCFTNSDGTFIGPIDRFNGASPYGALGMAGNVEEWVSDWYASVYPSGPATNPSGPSSGVQKVLRGGSWVSQPTHIRASRRNANAPDASSPTLTPEVNSTTFGIRCARSQ